MFAVFFLKRMCDRDEGRSNNDNCNDSNSRICVMTLHLLLWTLPPELGVLWF